MKKEIYFAGGCFWGVEKYFSLIEGVQNTTVGYTNGKTENPTYEEVCKMSTGHAETVKIEYDASIIDLNFLLDMFYQVIDPTSVNRQGHDTGVQYRSGIYYTDDSDLPVIRTSLDMLQERYDKPIAVEVTPLVHFFNAEAYHQKYLEKNPGGYCHIGSSAFQKAKEAKPQKSFSVPSQEELKSKLTPLQYEVTQNSATEAPFQNEYFDVFDKGIYVDIITGEPLFVSADKFESGCGWPSFSRPISNALLEEREDATLGRVRTEIRSKNSDSHLGHVFEDGPAASGGLRYCINSASLRFVPAADMEKEGYGSYLHLIK